MKMQRVILLSGLAFIGAVAACNKGDKTAGDQATSPSSAATSSGPAAGGRTIEVKLITDDAGNPYNINLADPNSANNVQQLSLDPTIIAARCSQSSDQQG